MKDASTGQLLRKLNSNFVPMDRIYGAGTLTKNRKTMSTPKYRPLDKQKLSRAGSRSSRADDRLAQLGFPKYHSIKTASQRQAGKAVEPQDGEEDDELPSVDDEYQGLGKNVRERQHQNYEALQRDVSARKVLPSTSDSPGTRPERRNPQATAKDQRPSQQRIVSAAYAGAGTDGEGKQRGHRSENREQPQPLQKQKRPMEPHHLGTAESQRNLKEPPLVGKDAAMPMISQMKLLPAGAKSSFRQNKPSSSRKVKRPESPGFASKNIVSGVQGKQREKISVYPTQRAQPMKGAPDAGA